MTFDRHDFDVLVLAAGKPHHGDTPSVLQKASVGQLVFDWLLDSYAVAPADVTFVVGFQADEIKQTYPDLNLIENRDWENTGSLHSFLLSDIDGARPLFVTYGDVLVRKELIGQMNQSDADIVIAIDRIDAQPGDTDIPKGKTARERVSVFGGNATRLGYDLSADWANSEFVGVVRFSAAARNRLDGYADQMRRLNKTAGLAEAIEFLRSQGETVAVFDTMGQWVEVIDAQDIAGFVLGTKADTLQRLRNVLTHSTIQDVSAFTVADWHENAPQVMDRVRAQFDGVADKLVVRSSARSEDTFYASNAGGYDSVLNVDVTTGLETAIIQVIGSYGSAELDDQVLVQPMLQDVALAGVVFTRTSEYYAPWYVINYETSGSTEGVTSGTSDNHLTLHVRRDAALGDVPTPELRPVVTALREIEARLGYDALDIEFAIDTKGTVHIFQVRPIAIKPSVALRPDGEFYGAIEQATAVWDRLKQAPPHIPGTHAPLYSVMTDWNPAEIIGTAPGKLAETFYRYLIMDDTWAAQRSAYGYRDLRPTPLLVTFAGKPYVDVRASLASFIPASLPDDLAGRFLDYYLACLHAQPELHDKVEFDILPTCLAPDFDVWVDRLTTDGGFSTAEVAQLRAALLAITENALTRCADDTAQLDILAARYTKIMATDMDPIERATLLLKDCHRFGTLPFAHLARSGFVAVSLLRGAEKTGAISAQARAGFMATIRTVSHDLTTDANAVAQGAQTWDDFVMKYGHLRPGTYDITSPRYDADAEHFLRPQVSTATQHTATDADTDDAHAWDTQRPAFLAALGDLGLSSDPDTVLSFLRDAIEGREYSKFVFTRSFSAAIEALAQAGAAIGLSRAEVSALPLSQVLALRDDALAPDERLEMLRDMATRNTAARALSAAMKLPPVIRSPGDLGCFAIGTELANFVGRTVTASECVNLEHADSDNMPDVRGRIAMIPQADPGYDWLFGQGIVGLVTMYGGVNSHMAIRAAEFGMSAAIGIGEQRYRQLAGAKMLHLDPLNQVLVAMS